MPFYGYNRPKAKISDGVRESFWLQGMMAGFPAGSWSVAAPNRGAPLRPCPSWHAADGS
jgi:hypothetical protein